MVISRARQHASVLFIASVAFLRAANAEPDPPLFEGLGALPGPTVSSTAACTSADGSVIAGGSASFAGSQACLWIGRPGPIALGDLPGAPFKSFAVAMSSDGSVIVGYGNHGSDMVAEAFRWSKGVMQGLGFPDGMSNSWGNDVSADGSTVAVTSNISTAGTFWTANTYLWTEAGEFVQLPHIPDGVYLSAHAISADASVAAGTASTTSAYQAFRWTSDGGTQTLGYLPGGMFDSRGYDVSADGNVVVGSSWSSSGTQAFRWIAVEGMEGLGYLPGGSGYSEAISTNADGSVVVGIASTGGSGNRVFIWDAHYSMRTLSQALSDMQVTIPSGWTLGFVRSISPDGRTIVGVGTNPNGQFEAYRARLRRQGDAVSDGVVNVVDLLSIINSWGSCPAPPTFCPADVAPPPSGDGEVNVLDLLMVINNWG